MELDDLLSFELLDNNTSFVIIQKMSAENQKQIELTDNILKNSSFSTLMEKFDPENITKNHPLAEGIENTVQELLKENVKLKETLQQNNTTMKQQFNNLTKWHEEVFNTHRTHKQKFEETKDLILKLRAENKELKKQVQEIIKSVENKLIHEINEMKHERECLQLQFQDSEQRCTYYKSQLANLSKVSVENQLLKEKLSITQQKLCKLEQHFAMNTRSEKEQELIQVIGDLSKQLENSERARRKLTIDVDRLTAQEQKLQRILPSGESRSVTDCCYWNAIFPIAVISTPFEVQLVENIKRLEELLNKSEDCNSNKEENKELNSTSWVTVTPNEEQNAESLKLEAAELRKLLLLEQAISVNRKEILENARIKLKEIYKQCVTILKDHDTKMKAQEIEIVKNREKLKEIDNLKCEICDKQNQITQFETDFNFFKKKLEEAERKNEDLYLLRNQIKVYEEDFISEREARDALASEKDILEHNLNCLQQKNEELLRELKLSHQGEYNSLRNIPSEQFQQRTNKYTCFNDECAKSFASEDELQEHVYMCLNLKD